MKNLDFKYIAAENFACFGQDGIELDLKAYGNIVHITGLNFDCLDDSGEPSRNGVGKSTIPDILVYTLYGKSLKSLTHKQLINSKSKKKLRTEVRWGDYRVVRTRNPDSLRVWESAEGVWDDSTEISLGGMPATQKLIEDKIGLNFVTFSKVVVFTDDSKNSFLESDTPTKREIVENLLSLEKYRAYGERVKAVIKDLKKKVADIARDYDRLLIELNSCKDRIIKMTQKESDWRTERLNEVKVLKAKIKQKNEELSSTGDDGAALVAYTAAREELDAIFKELPVLEEKKQKVEKILQEAEGRLETETSNKHELKLKIGTLKNTISEAQKEVNTIQNKIEALKNKKQTRCHDCFGVVSSENADAYAKSVHKKLMDSQSLIETTNTELEKAEKKFTSFDAVVKMYSDGISSAKEKLRETITTIKNLGNKINSLNKVTKPEVGVDERVLQEQIETLTKQVEEKTKEANGVSPFAEIIVDANKDVEAKQNECDTKKVELKDAEADLPYYEFYLVAFGDRGIRKWVIDDVTPALNTRISYWMQFLINGKIKLKFNNELEETIDRVPEDGDAFVYAQMSKGEKQRLNITVSQAWAHVMMLSSSIMPSCVWLDEVSTNVDPVGVVGIYNMICELAKDRQVFVSTHDHGLLSMLEGYDSIHLEKKSGFTKLIK